MIPNAKGIQKILFSRPGVVDGSPAAGNIREKQQLAPFVHSQVGGRGQVDCVGGGDHPLRLVRPELIVVVGFVVIEDRGVQIRGNDGGGVSGVDEEGRVVVREVQHQIRRIGGYSLPIRKNKFSNRRGLKTTIQKEFNNLYLGTYSLRIISIALFRYKKRLTWLSTLR